MQEEGLSQKECEGADGISTTSLGALNKRHYCFLYCSRAERERYINLFPSYKNVFMRCARGKHRSREFPAFRRWHNSGIRNARRINGRRERKRERERTWSFLESFISLLIVGKLSEFLRSLQSFVSLYNLFASVRLVSISAAKNEGVKRQESRFENGAGVASTHEGKVRGISTRKRKNGVGERENHEGARKWGSSVLRYSGVKRGRGSPRMALANDVTSELAVSNDSFVLGVPEFRVSLRVHL